MVTTARVMTMVARTTSTRATRTMTNKIVGLKLELMLKMIFSFHSRQNMLSTNEEPTHCNTKDFVKRSSHHISNLV
jgi:hypothetical protein